MNYKPSSFPKEATPPMTSTAGPSDMDCHECPPMPNPSQSKLKVIIENRHLVVPATPENERRTIPLSSLPSMPLVGAPISKPPSVSPSTSVCDTQDAMMIDDQRSYSKKMSESSQNQAIPGVIRHKSYFAKVA